MTYPTIEPYMKGIHLTAEAWRSNWDEEGWRIEESLLDTRLLTLDEETGVYVLESDYRQEPGQEPPINLKAVPRLLLDIRARRAILRGPTPIMRILRPRSSVNVFYGFGDTSGEGYGKAMRNAEGRGKIDFEYGFWCSVSPLIATPTHALTDIQYEIDL
jgi:hypothetical protein